MEFPELYERARAVLNPRRLSDSAEAGGVGAAILTAGGNVYCGVCIDTACSMGFCAEHAAAAAMVTAGENHIVKVVAVGWDGHVMPPCGRCREFMSQLHADNLSAEVMVAEGVVVKLQELLPHDWRQACKGLSIGGDMLVRLLEAYHACFPLLRTDIEAFVHRLGLDSGTRLLLRMDGTAVVGFAAVRGDGILILCVPPKYSNCGIGTSLLNEAQAIIEQQGYDRVILGLGDNHYLMQGVPASGNRGFFEKRGYSASWSSIDMTMRLADFDLGGLQGYPYNRAAVFRCLKAASAELLSAVEQAKPPWVPLFTSEQDIVVAEVDGEIASFVILLRDGLSFAASFDGTTAGLGCLGTVPKFRCQGIGLTLAAYATGILKEEGFTHSYLGYTWLKDWYGRLGYAPYMEFWMGEKQLNR
jgi:cytidine deaminase